MDVKKAIETRKSIRKFKEKEVPDEIIKEVIDAARRAPSAHNLQPWHFIAVKSKEKIAKFKEQGVFVQEWLYNVPVIIVCCAEKSISPDTKKELEENIQLIDLSLASAFLVLRATELGLGARFVSWTYKEKLKKILGVPENVILPYVIAMGYPDEDPKPKEKKKLEEIISFEKW